MFFERPSPSKLPHMRNYNYSQTYAKVKMLHKQFLLLLEGERPSQLHKSYIVCLCTQHSA